MPAGGSGATLSSPQVARVSWAKEWLLLVCWYGGWVLQEQPPDFNLLVLEGGHRVTSGCLQQRSESDSPWLPQDSESERTRDDSERQLSPFGLLNWAGQHDFSVFS